MEFDKWENMYGKTIGYTEPIGFRKALIEERVEELEHENDFLRKELNGYKGKLKRVSLPEHYIINEDATILFWNKCKKEKTIVKRTADDEFNARLGFLTAFFQHYSGMTKSKANKYLANLKVEEKE